MGAPFDVGHNMVVDLTDDLLGDIPVVSNLWEIVKDGIDTIWQEFWEPILVFILSIFGISDEDVISTNVTTVRIIDDEVNDTLLSNVALRHQARPDTGVIEHLQLATNEVRGRYNRYFTYGENKYTHGLPTTNLSSSTANVGVVKQAIDEEYSIDSTIISAEIDVPTKEEYVGWKLREDYQYDAYNYTLQLNGSEYEVRTIDYNYLTNNYDITCIIEELVTTTIITTTTITITPIDAVVDNKNTTVTERTLVEGTLSGVVSDVTIELSNIDEEIPIGTEGDSVESIEDITTVNSIVDTQILSVEAFEPYRYYIAKYYTTDISEWQYWVYNPNDEIYPYVDSSNTSTSNLEMLPIVAIRRNSINVAADDTTDEYKEAEDMLGILGLDLESMTETLEENPNISNVEDAYVHFSLNPSDLDPIVSKMLYDTFEFVFVDTSLYDQDGNGGYTATVTEGSFNTAMLWTDQTKEIVVGSIGDPGTYEHEIVDQTLILRKQETVLEYVEYQVIGMGATTLIDRGGLVGVNTVQLGDDEFHIPLSLFFIKSLTPLEQTTIFAKSLKLSIYAAQVTHLEYYQTERFAVVLKIVAIIVLVFSYGYASDKAAWLWSLAASIAAGYALKKVFETTDNKYIRTIAVIAYIWLSYSRGQTTGQEGVVTADQVSLMSTEFVTAVAGGLSTAAGLITAEGYVALAGAQTAFTSQYEERLQEIEDASTGTSSYTTTDIVELNAMEDMYIQGYDEMMDVALQGPAYRYGDLYSKGPDDIMYFYDEALDTSTFNGGKQQFSMLG